jgi:hypothetical protein
VIIFSLYKASKNRENLITAQIPNKRKKSTNQNHSSNNIYLRNMKDMLFKKDAFSYSSEHCDNSDFQTRINFKTSDSNSNQLFSRTFSLKNPHLQQQQQQQTPHGLTKEKQITIMLLTACISFFILTMPYSAFELMRKIGANSPYLKNRNVMRAFMLLIDINHATNFILYCLTAQRFRTELKDIIFKCWPFKIEDKNGRNRSKYDPNKSLESCYNTIHK